VSERRTLIRLDSLALAMSLDSRLEQTLSGVGERGLNVNPGGPCEIVFAECPRRPDQAGEILDVVSAWLDETGQPGATVEFRWQLHRSKTGQTRAQQPVLYWKCEDGPEDAGPNGFRDDMGPAWLQTQDAHGNVTSEPINDGEWISRTQASSEAANKGWTLSLDG
jgi:hypothetical protein